MQERLFTTRQEGTTNDDYHTPKWIFDAIGVEFDLDVACPPDGPLHTPCKAYYTQEDDGLAQEWYGTVWMNPPYSDPKHWVKKFIEHGNGIALVPFTRAMWHDALWQSNCKSMAVARNPNGRLMTFERDGKSLGIFMPVCIWAAGSMCIKAIEQSGIGRVR